MLGSFEKSFGSDGPLFSPLLTKIRDLSIRNDSKWSKALRRDRSNSSWRSHRSPIGNGLGHERLNLAVEAVVQNRHVEGLSHCYLMVVGLKSLVTIHHRCVNGTIKGAIESNHFIILVN